MANIDAALQYIQHGFKVFPVKTDKTPLTPHGLKDATETILGVREYWGKWPDAGIGVVTDGLVVLDFDKDSGGLESMEAMAVKYGDFPDTRTHLTGGGGYHKLYRNPSGTDIRNTTRLGGYPGVDVRADGGYIIVPPSLHASGGKYKVINKAALAPAPDWLVELLKQPSNAPVLSVEGSITEGQRDSTLASLAGSMRRRGMSQESILAALATENRSRCSPPLPDKDVARIASSVSRYTPEPSSTTEDPPDIEQAIDILNKPNKPNTFNKTEQVNTGAYKNIARMVERWLPLHKGETFDLDTICRQLSITDRDDRHRVTIRLYHAVESEVLAKVGRLYSYIDKTCKLIRWWEASDEGRVALRWPYGHEDNSGFDFADNVSISAGDIVIVAGVSNMGKTTLCMNLLVENMDYFPCTLMGNEYTGSKFKRRLSRMNWCNPLTEEGLPKFDLIERREKWQDIIKPDNINIIDWINLSDNFYQVGAIIEGIQAKLRNGIAIISLQKSEGKSLGLGGGFSEHLASLYLAVDFERLTVRKAKEWTGKNPNGKMYGFSIVDGGSKFHNIREVKPCRSCSSTGKGKGGDCEKCIGKGYIDA